MRAGASWRTGALITWAALLNTPGAAKAPGETWDELCRIPGRSIHEELDARRSTSTDLTFEARGQVLLSEPWSQRDGRAPAILRMPGCVLHEFAPLRVSGLAAPYPRILSLSADGVLLWERTEGVQVLSRPGVEDLVLPSMAGEPLLSTDGRWVATVDLQPARATLKLYSTTGEAAREIRLSGEPENALTGRCSPRLTRVDVSAGLLEVVTCRARRHTVELLQWGFDGSLQQVIERSAPFAYLGSPRAWVAWGTEFQSSAPVTWSVGGRRGSYAPPRFHHVEEASLEPAGRYIAVRIAVNSGGSGHLTPDTLLHAGFSWVVDRGGIRVLRISDGVEIFSERIKGSGASVRFVGPAALAVSSWDSAVTPVTRVLRVPRD